MTHWREHLKTGVGVHGCTVHICKIHNLNDGRYKLLKGRASIWNQEFSLKLLADEFLQVEHLGITPTVVEYLTQAN